MTTTVSRLTPAAPSLWQRTWWLLRDNPTMSLGLVIVLLYVVVALAGPLITPYDPLDTNPRSTFEAPSSTFLMGTDKFGRDVFSRIVYAARLDLTIAFTVAASAFFIGSIIGGASGYYGGWVDEIVMRVVDIVFAFPAFILAMAITAVLGDSVRNVIIAITIAYIPYFVRLTRGEMLRIRKQQYADAAVTVGNPGWRVMLVHLLPNALTPSLVQMSLVAGWAILDAAGLAFLGLGVTPPTAEWGVMVFEGSQRIISGEWWTWLFPGLAILIVVFAFNMLGDGLRTVGGGDTKA